MKSHEPIRCPISNSILADRSVCVDGVTRETLTRYNLIEDTGIGRQVTGVRIGRQAGEVILQDNTIKANRPTFDERAESSPKNGNDDPSTDKAR